MLLGPVAQAQPRAQPADQVPRFLDLPPQAPRLQDGVHQLERLPDGAGHRPSAEPRELPARGAERTGQEAPPLVAVGAQGLTLREHVLVPGLGDEDGIVPRAELGEAAGGLGHLLDARGLGDPTRAAVIGVPERRSVQGRARGADHPLHVRGLLLPERPVTAEPPDQLLRLPSQAAQRPDAASRTWRTACSSVGTKSSRPHGHHRCLHGTPIARTSSWSSRATSRRRMNCSSLHDTESRIGSPGPSTSSPSSLSCARRPTRSAGSGRSVRPAS